MKISDIEHFIKTRDEDKIDASQKVIEKLKERRLNIKEIKQIILNRNIHGILDQGENVYKIWFEYTNEYDLNVVIRIKDKTCYIVTAFPCEIERRVKHGKTKREKG